MNKTAISKVTKHVRRKFPDLSKSVPKIKKQGNNYSMIYTGKVKTPDGNSMNRSVRVTADESGNVIKLTTSR